MEVRCNVPVWEYIHSEWEHRYSRQADRTHRLRKQFPIWLTVAERGCFLLIGCTCCQHGQVARVCDGLQNPGCQTSAWWPGLSLLPCSNQAKNPGPRKSQLAIAAYKMVAGESGLTKTAGMAPGPSR